MNISQRTCFRNAVCAAVLLALGVAGAAIPAQAQTYTDLHDFNSGAGDPFNFSSNKLAQGQDGNLYTESISGGTSGAGTVFKITPTGTPTIVFSFTSTSGFNPLGGLTAGHDGNFYGDTQQGGTGGDGTVFKVTPKGVLKVLHNFVNTGEGPPTNALVLGVDGKFYGTTDVSSPGATIYSVTAGGVFKTLHTLTAAEGYQGGQLTQGSDSLLYGGMNLGGLNSQGTAYKMTTAGKLTVLHNFDGTDGSDAAPGMVQGRDGKFYGVASLGGTSSAGVIYQLTSSGGFNVLHNLNGTTDGSNVLGLTLGTDGNFYGLTTNGGSGCGTIFEVTTGGVFTVLHNFDNMHGCNSVTFLTERTDGLLYGLTPNGGANGEGVFFSLNVGLSPFVSLVTTSGKEGVKIGMLGQGFSKTSSVVKFGGVAATKITVTGSTYILATVPTGALTGSVTVTTGATTLTSTQTFKVLPTVTTFSPPSGPVGTPVMIMGTGLTQTTKVTFGGVAATIVMVNNDGEITANVPTGAKTGKIAVTTDGGSATSKTSFTVN